MSKTTSAKSVTIAFGDQPGQVINLKDPLVAGVLAWLVPGLGHLYQGRTAKGVLYMVCLLSTFAFGLYISGGKAVYASWDQGERLPHLPFVCQAGIGLPAMPALLQAYRKYHDKEPRFNGLMAPPASSTVLQSWYKDMGSYFELGMVYTMIAGLLNIFVIYDAWGGPSQYGEPDEKKDEKKDNKQLAAKPSSASESIAGPIEMSALLVPLAEINLLWYSAPLIVVISMVYSATRHEAMGPILVHSLRLGMMITLFMGVILALLAVLAWWL